MDFRIRPATSEDIEDLAKLLGVLYAIEKDFTPDRRKQLKGLTMMLGASEERIVLVAERQMAIIGMVTGQITISTAEGGLSAIVEDLVVLAPFRGKGVGKRLLLSVENWARSMGAVRVTLLADRDNLPAADFYEKAGWGQTNMICRKKESFHSEAEEARTYHQSHGRIKKAHNA
jgi:GNAT superfamily N-acetyltransferase